ncbi:DNA alkylation repair protein [Criibacterium bergeronii]|uniref:DNA alkylation repair protein n=1 Tax=Criibacterium bergeronii TaxID=1871336 RepID=A0A371IIT4_9FIRM|nr:DNA alkylation repair protein [Criibacterium bergeronii]RDY20388.1 DNA alkylation repair protein [Criibacterium bergeronii]
MNLQEELFSLQDTKYKEFQARLIPNIDSGRIMGVRLPILRKLAKKIETQAFLNELPKKYFEEDLLQGIIISNIKDYQNCIEKLENFLPYVDNWAACDTISPNIFKKHKTELILKINNWIKSKHTYTCRFGLKMLMTHYLDTDFKKSYLKLPLQINSDEYYVNMMIAWFYATALAKRWQETISYLEGKKLDKWVHNKTIQKAVESYRITDEQKNYLRQLKL